MLNKLPIIISFIALLAPTAALSADQNQSFLTTERYENFVTEMVNEHGFKAETVHSLMKTAYFQQHIIDKITKPAEGLPWHKYRKIFLKTDRIKQGVEFWQSHAKILDGVEQDTGVPAELIVAIIGVETKYGQYQGKHRVLDALATLGFYYPKRGDFFLSELKHFLLMTREENLDANALKGSYAGAMGMPQFISSSYRHYAADFDKDEQRDLWNNPGDAIASVANYFVEHGWQKSAPIANKLSTSNIQKAEKYLEKHGKPIFSSGDIANALPTAKIQESVAMSALMEFELTNGKEYWQSFKNFYVITRYNHSRLYALAALQLAAEIKSSYRSAKTQR